MQDSSEKSNIFKSESFKSFGDELRYLSKKTSINSTIAMESLLSSIIDTITNFLRDNYIEFPNKWVEIGLYAIFLSEEYFGDFSLYASFREATKKFGSEIPTFGEINWYGEKLEEHFCKEDIQAKYDKTKNSLTLKW